MAASLLKKALEPILDPATDSLLPKKRYRFTKPVILDSVPQECSLQFDEDATVGNLGSHVHISGLKNLIVKGHIASDCTLDVSGNIRFIYTPGHSCTARSSDGDIILETFASDPATFTADKGNIVCKGYCNHPSIELNAPQGTIKSPFGITARKIHARALKVDNFTADDVLITGNRLVISDTNNVNMNLKVPNGILFCKNNLVADNVTARAIRAGNIACKKAIATESNIKIAKNVLEHSHLKALKGDIAVKHSLMNNAMLSSPTGRVSVGISAMSGSVIKAKKGIDIGAAQAGSWMETEGIVHGMTKPGSYVKQEQTPIKDYDSRPNMIAKHRAKAFMTPGLAGRRYD